MDDIVNSVARHFLPFPQSRFYRLCYPQVFPHTVLKCSSVEHHPPLPWTISHPFNCCRLLLPFSLVKDLMQSLRPT